MFEAQEDFDLSQGALTVRLVLEGADLLDGHADLVVAVVGRAAFKRGKKTNIQLVTSVTGGNLGAVLRKKSSSITFCLWRQNNICSS